MGKAVRCPTSPLLPDFLASYGTPMQLLELGDSSGDTRGKRKLDQDFRSGERGKVLYSSRKAELSPGGARGPDFRGGDSPEDPKFS